MNAFAAEAKFIKNLYLMTVGLFIISTLKTAVAASAFLNK
jgi:hypothetical protein